MDGSSQFLECVNKSDCFQLLREPSYSSHCSHLALICGVRLLTYSLEVCTFQSKTRISRNSHGTHKMFHFLLSALSNSGSVAMFPVSYAGVLTRMLLFHCWTSKKQAFIPFELGSQKEVASHYSQEAKERKSCSF